MTVMTKEFSVSLCRACDRDPVRDRMGVQLLLEKPNAVCSVAW
jgi:hypothetical protein